MKVNIGNLKIAVAYLSTIPALRWHMGLFWSSPLDCGCALGHLANGRILNMEREENSYPTLAGTSWGPFKTSDALFGEKVYENLFTSEGIPILSDTEIAKSKYGKKFFFDRLLKFMQKENIPFEAIFGTNDLPKDLRTEMKAKDECLA